MNEIDQMFEDSLKRRAFSDGVQSQGTSAKNPYADPIAKAAWAAGFALGKTTGKCERCEEEDISPVIEAFELSGQIVCEDCAEEVFEENSQFGMGA